MHHSHYHSITEQPLLLLHYGRVHRRRDSGGGAWSCMNLEQMDVHIMVALEILYMLARPPLHLTDVLEILALAMLPTIQRLDCICCVLVGLTRRITSKMSSLLIYFGKKLPRRMEPSGACEGRRESRRQRWRHRIPSKARSNLLTVPFYCKFSRARKPHSSVGKRPEGAWTPLGLTPRQSARIVLRSSEAAIRVTHWLGTSLWTPRSGSEYFQPTCSASVYAPIIHV
jgi:hypothetical protein